MKNFRLHFIALAAILFVAVSPAIPVILASAVANINGCRLDEGSTHPCVILGRDFGGLLYEMGVLGWLGLVTIPAAVFLLLAWAAWVVTTLFKVRKARKNQPG